MAALVGLVVSCVVMPARADVPRLDEAAAVRTGEAAIGRLVTDFTLLDRQGRPVRLSSYRGKPLLVSFVYTGCFEVCPTSTRTLHETVKALGSLLSSDQFNVVSIGFNQPFDSPAALRAFSAQHRVDAPNWEFLSPPAAIVDRLTAELGFSYLATPAGFDHVLGVTVIDAQGRVHAQVYGDRISVDKLGEPLRQLLGRQGGPTGANPVSAFVERVRILCSVYDPKTGQYRTNYALLFEIIGGVGFFLTVGIYLRGERRRHRSEREAARGRSSGVRAEPAATTSDL